MTQLAKPFMPPTRSDIRKAGLTALFRTAAAHLIAKREGGSPDRIIARQWPNDRDAALLVKGAVAALAGFVREGYPIPVRQLQVRPLLLDPSKLAVISPFSEEMVTGSAGTVQRMVEGFSPSASSRSASSWTSSRGTSDIRADPSSGSTRSRIACS